MRKGLERAREAAIAENSVERRLAAILSADVVGYSRLMEADETGTLARLQAHRREVIDPQIAAHHGRLVKLMGDGALVEFASVVEAVECAVAIQAGMAARNAEEPEDQRIELRIGINLGDILVEGDDIYGDGVNVAARMQELAEPGGICISDDAFRQVERRSELGFADLGEQHVKNIVRPVRAYRVLREAGAAGMATVRAARPRHWSRWVVVAAAAAIAVVLVVWAAVEQPWRERVEPASLAAMAFPLPERPSIAVLPFANLSGDPEQDYFGDGITEDIITALSRFPEVFVIARNSSFTYKGKPVKVQQVAEELGVRYVLEGSVQRSGKRLRVTAQLIDALTGYHLWSERYEREMADVFELQDELTQRIVAALSLELTDAEIERARLKDTDDPKAYDLVLRSRPYCCTLIKADNDKARGLLEQAIAVDPDFARAYSFLAWTHLHDWQLGWTDDPESSLGRAFELATKAVALDEDDFAARSALSEVYLWQRQFERAAAAMERAIALNPNQPDLYRGRADILVWAGQPQEALAHVEKAARLSPKTQFTNFWVRGHAYFLLERYAEAATAFAGSIERNPGFWPSHLFLAASYGHLGRTKEARAAYERAIEVHPALSSAQHKPTAPYKNPADFERIGAGLQKAGLVPEPEAALALPDRPSIAVLPFTNMSDDPGQEWFAEGMADDLITDLSRSLACS